mmetsp:Transcript_101546/g.206188  ORF Transcript_101546/g.206188 Transcript_101546/m.206188 type:complete len:279 (-) Transcript_101546:1304-2140(-)
MSSTVETSMSSALISMGSAGSSFSSPPSAFASSAFFFASSFFLAISAFFFAGSFHSFCFLRHSWNVFCHFVQDSLKASPGLMSSARDVSFFCKTQSLRNWSLAASASQTQEMVSKPSSFVGMEKFAKLANKAFSVISGCSSFRYQSFFSSSVSSTGVSSASSSIFSSSGSFFSSSTTSSSLPSFFFRAASFAFLASSAFRFFSSRSLLRSASCAFFFFAISAFACLSAKIKAPTWSLYSWLGSPIITVAVFLNPCALNFRRASFLSEATRFALSSGTM